jgi:hypothetical protein
MFEHEFVTAMLGVVSLEVIAMSYTAYRIYKILNWLDVRVAPTSLEIARALSQPW